MGQMGHMMSQNRGFLFSRKRFSRFLGVQHAILTPMDVPKSGILVFQKKVFAFFGGAICEIGADGCPKIGVLISKKKVFAFLGHSLKWGEGMSFFWVRNKI
jgi:hypothetical protein